MSVRTIDIAVTAQASISLILCTSVGPSIVHMKWGLFSQILFPLKEINFKLVAVFFVNNTYKIVNIYVFTESANCAF